MSKYKISYSTLNKLKEDGCKRLWFEKNVMKSIPRDDPSEQMIKGQVFETLAIGCNVSGEEMPNHEFLYDSKGKERVELTRIKEQAEKFKRVTDPENEEYLGFSVKETQLKLENDTSKGVIDILGEDDFLTPVISDLKFTSNVTQTFGNYAWGRDPNEIDWTQLGMYNILYRDNYESYYDPKTNIMVFDSSPAMGSKLFDVKLSDNYLDNVQQEIDMVNDFIDRATNDSKLIELKVKPSKKECESCPIDCQFRFKESLIEKIKVNV